MNEYRASEQERQRAEKIRRQYISREDNAIRQLEKLDNKVKFPGKIISVILGVVSALVMGAGMALIMVWKQLLLGLAFSIPGLIVALLAYPIYALITNSRRRKFAEEIMRLSDAVIKH